MKKVIAIIFSLFFSTYSVYAQIINTIAGSAASSYIYSGEGGPATLATLRSVDVKVDRAGNVYLTDQGSQRVCKINVAGIITTIAGNGTPGYSGDNGPATAALINQPYGMDMDTAGNIYFADVENHSIRKISASGIITTVAGSGVSGYSGDGGAATLAKLKSPVSVAVDRLGNLFINDGGNNCFRKVNAAGTITTYAGNGTMSYSGDGGPATAAGLYLPNFMAVDAAGNLYIGDIDNNRLRMVNTAGIISTIAGNGTMAFSGDGGPATAASISGPNGVAIDGSGNIFVTEAFDSRIRKINTAGIISSVAGIGTIGFSGDGGPATAAEFHTLQSLTVDCLGNIYLADEYNNRIRKIGTGSCTSLPTQVNTPEGTATTLRVYPNPSSDGVFTLYIPSAVDEQARIIITNAVGSSVKEFFAATNHDFNLQLDLSAGVYLLSASTANSRYNAKITLVR